MGTPGCNTASARWGELGRPPADPVERRGGGGAYRTRPEPDRLGRSMAGLCRSPTEPAAPGRGGPGPAGACGSGGGRGRGVPARGGGVGAAGRGGESPGTRLQGCVGRGAVWRLALGGLGSGSVGHRGIRTLGWFGTGTGLGPVVSLGTGALGSLGSGSVGWFGTGTGLGPVVSLGTGSMGSCRTGPVVSLRTGALGSLGTGSVGNRGIRTLGWFGTGTGLGPVVSLGTGALGSLGSGSVGWFGTGTGLGPVVSLWSGSVGNLGIRTLGWFGTGTGLGPVVSLGTGSMGSCRTGPVVSLRTGALGSLGSGSVGRRGIRTLGWFGTGTGLGPVVSLGTQTPGHLGTGSVLYLRTGSQGCRGAGSVVSLGTGVLGRGAWWNPARSYRHWPSQPWARPVSTDLPRDVTLFRNHRPHFFRLLGLFCGAQALFWAYLAHLAFTSLRDTGYEETVLVGDRAEGLPKIGGIALNLGSDKWRYGFTASCLTVGCLILAAGSAFSRRSVCGVVLHRGGQEVTISSHRLLGGSRSFRVPLRDLSCMAHRHQVASVIPLKVRGHRLYYLLDRRGQFHHPGLFDVTVGAYRSL
ncbi:transmembrane protein 223 [Mobula birostris]|uniref:transmembrane protein 223 n=1 Tax=Mobula birostris TaxID=1983395 RepID=UPI003B284558